MTANPLARFWTAQEEDLLLSLIHISKPGGRSQRIRTWAQVGQAMKEQSSSMGIANRDYTSIVVEQHYNTVLMGKVLWEQKAKDRYGKAEGVSGTLSLLREGTKSHTKPSGQPSRPSESGVTAEQPSFGDNWTIEEEAIMSSLSPWWEDSESDAVPLVQPSKRNNSREVMKLPAFGHNWTAEGEVIMSSLSHCWEGPDSDRVPLLQPSRPTSPSMTAEQTSLDDDLTSEEEDPMPRRVRRLSQPPQKLGRDLASPPKEVEGPVYPWFGEEDDLLLSLVHASRPLDRCEQSHTWALIADIMNEQALRDGIGTRVYHGRNVAERYNVLVCQGLEKGQVSKDIAIATATAVSAESQMSLSAWPFGSPSKVTKHPKQDKGNQGVEDKQSDRQRQDTLPR